MAGRLELQGASALVTGAARGIGAETARRLFAKGARVSLVGLEPERLERLAAELGVSRAMWVEADVTDADALRDAVDATVRRFGGLDVAVANAGIHLVGAFATSPLERILREIDVNLLGVVRTDHAVLPHIIASRGYLLNVASLAAAAHAPLMTSYAASKAGVEALTDSLRAELVPTGARAGCAYFGFIDTDMVREGMAHPSSAVMQPLMPRWMAKPIPVGRAADAVIRAVERRSARTWAPRWVGAALALRGLTQPLTERRIASSPELARAVELAAPAPDIADVSETAVAPEDRPGLAAVG